MDILELIKKRRTIRKYKNKPIPKRILNKIIEAGRWAPSAHNYQPWKFIIIRTEETKRGFIKYLGGFPSKNFLTSINILLKNSIEIIKNTPVIILVYNDRKFSKKALNLGTVYKYLAHISEVESVSAAIENMCLVSTYLGLGMAWLTMPLLIKDRINRFFNTNDDLVAILTFGYPAEKGKRSPRKPLSETVKYL